MGAIKQWRYSIGGLWGTFLSTISSPSFFLMDLSFERAIIILILIAYGWELIERTLESYDHHKRFFKEKEGWMNRYVGDILADVVGFLLAWFY